MGAYRRPGERWYNSKRATIRVAALLQRLIAESLIGTLLGELCRT